MWDDMCDTGNMPYMQRHRLGTDSVPAVDIELPLVWNLLQELDGVPHVPEHHGFKRVWNIDGELHVVRDVLSPTWEVSFVSEHHDDRRVWSIDRRLPLVW